MERSREWGRTRSPDESPGSVQARHRDIVGGQGAVAEFGSNEDVKTAKAYADAYCSFWLCVYFPKYSSEAGVFGRLLAPHRGFS